MRRWVVALGLCILATPAFTQEGEAIKAESLYQSGNRLGALPYYEALTKANPNELLYAERLTVCLYTQSAGMQDGPARRELLDKIQAEAKTAVSLGSQETASLVIANFDLSLASKEKGETLAQAIWLSGEPYYGKKDFKEALNRYATAAELEPKAPEPAYFAGDAAQMLGDLPAAESWYEKALRLAPHGAKVYVHWGDAIMKIAHDPNGARAKYIDAIVADPYGTRGRQRLAEWAEAQGAVLAPPQIKPPNGGMEMFKTMGHDPSTRTPWTTYVLDEFAYQTNAKASPIGTFHKDYPSEAKARRSLLGETKALHATALEAASNAEKQGKPADEFRDLIEVDKAGMLECWVIFHWSDQNMEQDYRQFSTEHWKILHDYIDRFEIHGGVR
jgi:hypothetical protein